MAQNTTSVEELLERVAALEANSKTFFSQSDVRWILQASHGIFFMQLGFILLEAGSVKAVNVKSIMLKNVLDTTVCGIVWYLWGFYISNHFNDSHDANLDAHNTEIYSTWLFSMTFASCATTIVSGGAASRMKTFPHMIISIVSSGWIYPTFAYWIWSETGWLHHLGALDFAGGSSVHILGGLGSLCGAMSVGPRHGRFIRSVGGVISIRDMKGHDSVQQLTGTFILWFGWLSFNGGSFGYTGNDANLQSLSVINTMLSGCAGGLVMYIYKTFINQMDLGDVGKGILSGLVGITPSCAFVPTWAAIIIGVASALSTEHSSRLLVKHGIDDPVDAFATHTPPALIGMVSIGVFALPVQLQAYRSGGAGVAGLAFGGDWSLLGVQVLACVTAIVWSLQFGLVMFLYRYISPKLPPQTQYRYSKEEEKHGLDSWFYGGYAYPDQVYSHDLNTFPQQAQYTTLRSRKGSQKPIPSEETESVSPRFGDTIMEMPQVNLGLAGGFFVRAANSSDAGQIFNVVNAAYGVEKNGGEFSFKTEDRFLCIADVQALMKTSGVKTFVAIETGSSLEVKIVGAVVVTKELSKKASGTVVLGPFGVAPDYQRRGVAKKMLTEIVKYFAKEGAKQMEARVINWRLDLWPVYTKLGFVETSLTLPYDGAATAREGTHLVVFSRGVSAADDDEEVAV
jgi:Amt family ammonium transporter